MFMIILVSEILILLFLVIGITVIYIVLKKRQSDRSASNKGPDFGDPIDPRYGQLDSSLNLSLKLANPSYVSLDNQMAIDEKALEKKAAPDEIKSESDSAKPKAKTTPKTPKSPKSPK